MFEQYLLFQELEVLANELRQDIVYTVSKTGGHLSSSLGVAELTVALHHVFNSPEDKIIWDVGHQVIHQSFSIYIFMQALSNSSGASYLLPFFFLVELKVVYWINLGACLQAYPHKILTGRRSRMHTIRQTCGLAGFPKREESVHDAFGAGHSSTSISAGLGIENS